jgi:hypothetical protein
LLLEPSRENLCIRSEELNDAAWAKTAAGSGVAPSVTANAGTAPVIWLFNRAVLGFAL